MPVSNPLSALDPSDCQWLSSGDNAAGAAQLLREHGLVLCRDATTFADFIRSEVDAALSAALALPPSDAAAVLNEVRTPANRHDVRLDMTPGMLSLLRQVVASDSAIGMAVRRRATANRVPVCVRGCDPAVRLGAAVLWRMSLVRSLRRSSAREPSFASARASVRTQAWTPRACARTRPHARVCPQPPRVYASRMPHR